MLWAHFRIGGHCWGKNRPCRFVEIWVGHIEITVFPWGSRNEHQGWIAATQVYAKLRREFVFDPPREMRLRLGNTPLASLARWVRRQYSREKHYLGNAYWHRPKGQTEIRF